MIGVAPKIKIKIQRIQILRKMCKYADFYFDMKKICLHIFKLKKCPILINLCQTCIIKAIFSYASTCPQIHPQACTRIGGGEDASVLTSFYKIQCVNPHASLWSDDGF